MQIKVREPDEFHNHWGITIRLLPDEDCREVVREAMHILKPWNVFHQSGSHDFDERCGQYHYFEMWAMKGEHEWRMKVNELIQELEDFNAKEAEANGTATS